MKEIKNNSMHGHKKNERKTKSVFPGKDLFVKYVIGILSLVCAVVLVHRSRLVTQPILSAGEIARQDIRAQIDFRYIDEDTTRLLRKEAGKKVPDLYIIDKQSEEDAFLRIKHLFDLISGGADAAEIKKKAGWLDSEAIDTLREVSNPGQVEKRALSICGELFEKGIITNSIKIRIISRGEDTIKMRDAKTGEVEERPLDSFVLKDELGQILDGRLRAVHPFDRAMRGAMKDLLYAVMSPNVICDINEINRMREKAEKSVSPVYINIRNGQTIIRRGDVITGGDIKILEEQKEKLKNTMPEFSKWWNAAGTALLTGMLFFILVTYLQYHQPGIFSSNKRLFLLSLIVLSMLGLMRFMAYIPVNADKPFWEYFIVVPISAMLVAVLMDKELAIVTSVILSLLATVLAEKAVPYIAVVVFGSIISIQCTIRLLHRWEFVKAGLFIGMANVLAVIMVTLLKLYSFDLFSWNVMGYEVLGGFASGVFCAMAVSAVLPVAERLFGITTSIRLLELSNLDHPLLKKMVTDAPGTYHHSMVVSSMAEDAAGAIGANALLAKVGAYFHDIGKIVKPQYFAENAWFEEKSRHDKLMPTISAMVITAHVKDGAGLAKRYGLPKDIRDIINEHHGTSLVYYFYRQAKKDSEGNGAQISEENFRYSGPKPYSKEAGIILLADAVEAASHTLAKPTPVKIEEMADIIIRDKIDDGQLNECGLTLRDINTVKKSFSHILTGILHKRVEYPHKDEDKSKNHRPARNAGAFGPS